MHTRIKAASICSCLFISGGAHADLIENGSFELGTFSPSSNQTVTLSPSSAALPGWQVVNDSIAWIGVGDPWGLDAQDGDLFLDLSDYSAGAPFGGVRQIFFTTPGYEYTVNFQLGSSNRWGRPATVSVGAAGQSASFVSAATGTGNDWQAFSFVFVASAYSSTLSFVGASGVNYIGLDNVSATVTAVPEPGVGALLLAGVATLVVGARRRKPSSLGLARP